MDASWVQVVINLAALVVVAVGGVYGVRRWWRRPRLYYETETFDLVQLAAEDRKQLAEQVLEAEGLPTSMCRVRWWNAGRSAASDITIDVETPGSIVDWSMDPGPDDVRGPWEMVNDPLAAGSGDRKNHLRLEQNEVKGQSDFVLNTGFHREREHNGTVRCYAGDREIDEYGSTARLELLLGTPALLFFLFAIGVAATMAAAADMPVEVLVPPPEAVIILAALLAVSAAIFQLLPRWSDFIHRRERLEDRE